MTERARHRHPVAPVEHVVAVGPLDQLDRRERVAAPVGQGDPLPAGPQDLGRGAEVRVEVGRRLERADDRVERDDLRARQSAGQHGGLAERPRVAALRPAPEPAAEPCDGVCAPSAAEVGLRVEHRHPGGVVLK